MKLTAAKRKKIPSSEFAGPDRSYPVNDAPHARNAKARASEAEHKGRISKAEEARIDAKADKVLGKNHHDTANDNDADDKKKRRRKAHQVLYPAMKE